MDTLLLDLRFALRSLRRRPTFALVAIATIALSIGAATSIYSVVDAVLFRSLPYRQAGQLVAVWQTHPRQRNDPILARNWDRVPLDYTDFMNWRAKQTSFSGVAVSSGWRGLLSSGGQVEQVIGKRVSPSFFETLGVEPILGRGILPGEDVIGGPHVVVVSYEAWQSRFGGRRDVVGQQVRFDDTPFTVVGVLPKGFTLERGKLGAPFWVPAGQEKGDVGLRNRSFVAVARLRPGVTIEQATTESARLLQGPDDSATTGLRLLAYQIDETRAVRGPLFVLLGAVGLLLVIACVNIATLLLGEAAAREQEIGARLALGASRGRLIAQLLTESVMLSVIGGVVGAALAWGGTKGLVALAPDRIPGILTVHVDLRVLGLTLCAALGTGLLFGALPALSLSGHQPSVVLRGGGQSARGRGALQRMLVAVELALSVVLLVGAALLTRSLTRLTSVDPGFRPDGLVTIGLAFPTEMLAAPGAARAFYHEASARIAALPGVVGVTGTNGVPFSGSTSSSGYFLRGEDPKNRDRRHTAQQRAVSPGYFAVMGIPLLDGRAFTDADAATSPRVAIITEAAARRDWPNQSPLGQDITYQGQTWTIVGIVADSKSLKLGDADLPMIYTSADQSDASGSLIVRVRGDRATAIAAIRRAIHDAGPSVALTTIEPMEAMIRRSFAEERFRTMLIALFGGMAAVLAAVGMYGVTARAVSRRTREVGIRVALGATGASVVRMIVGHTLSGVGVGVAAGTLVSLLASRILSPYLFGVGPNDPLSYTAIFALLAAVSIVASWIPARRASAVEPAIILRGE